MSTKLEQLKALAAQDVEESGVDMNEAVKGGSGRLLPAGYAFGRLVEYIEFGNQPQEFGGKAKDPALEFALGFALWGEGYQNEDGTPYIIRTYNTALSRNEKSRAYKMFKALNWKGTAKGYAQLLGETFLVKIEHKAKSATDPAIVSRLDLNGFLPPLDPVTRQPYAIPEATDELYRLFLWNHPTKEAWDSLWVEGKWDDGKSKNRLQETILSALDFQGSALQQLLMAAGVQSLPSAAVALPDLNAPAVVAPVAAAPATVAAPVAVPTVPVSAPAALAVPSVPVAAVTPLPATVSVAPAVIVPPAVVASPALPA